MKIAAVVRALVSAGATPEMILAAVEAAEAAGWAAYARHVPPDWPELRSVVFERDGLSCRYCQTEAGPFEVDHIIPVVRGGSDDLENLCVACKPCNASKGGRLLTEWRGRA